MSNNINIYAGPIKCPPLLSYTGISSIGALFRLYMVCNSLQGMDGLAAWGKRAMPSIQACTLGTGGVPNLIQDHTFGTNVQYTLGIQHGYTIYPCLYLGVHVPSLIQAIPTSGTPSGMVIPSCYHKWQEILYINPSLVHNVPSIIV
ncbi:hypothetical protein C8R44DRAFT_751144 [Mycena epipterygia]|nr:hypothetical protein C8R44DRAFT_751144 [Mycena epipterygia]